MDLGAVALERAVALGRAAALEITFDLEAHGSSYSLGS